jgi:putative transcriptional regulator
MKSLQAHLLVATPELRDPNFARTVVLLIGHNEEGAMGLVLNRPSETTIKDAWEQACESNCRRIDPVRVGGPCPGPLMALHQKPLLSNARIMDEVFLTQTPSLMEQLVEETDGAVRFFVGYAGWGPEQLEDELADGAWLAMPATAELVFPQVELDWDQLLQRAGSVNFYASLGFQHIPPDPHLN